MADRISIFLQSATLDEAEVQRVLKDFDGPVGQLGQQYATRVTRLAKAKAPVITGTLRNSLSTRTVKGGGSNGDLRWEISGIYYLEYVTEGNPGKPNDFVEDAALEVAAQFF